ncbi:MAG: nucleotidyltransferase family protein [bacterium]
MNKKEIKETINSQLPFLKEKYHIKKIGFFGSVARGDGKRESDIDIIVEFESPIGFFDFVRLENFLGEILQKKVDLVSKKALKPAIKERILKETIYV